jgi:hypothetical protein
MASRPSTITAIIATEAEACLRSGQFRSLAWFSPAETRKRLCFPFKSGTLSRRPSLRHRTHYVSARAEARSKSNVGQGHAGAVACYPLPFVVVPWRAEAGYHAGTVAPTLATPNHSIERTAAQPLMSNVSHMLLASVTTQPLGSYVQVCTLPPTRGRSVAARALPPSPPMRATAKALAIDGRNQAVVFPAELRRRSCQTPPHARCLPRFIALAYG